MDMARITYRTWTELEAYCFRAAGALHTLLAAVLSGGGTLTLTEHVFARRLGSAVRQVEMLRDRRIDIPVGRLYAPLDVLDATGVGPADLARPATTPAAEQFLRSWSARVHHELESLPEALADHTERARQRHGLVLGALHGRLLTRLTATQRGTADPPAELGPINRLWTAWRTALRYT
jgi:phytoene synthase